MMFMVTHFLASAVMWYAWHHVTISSTFDCRLCRSARSVVAEKDASGQ